MASFSRYCHQCKNHVLYFTSKSFLCTRCEERNHIPLADQTHDQCSTCKRIRPVCDFPLDRNNNRTLSCAPCLIRLRDVYREQRGELTKEGRACRLAQTRQVIEKALKARIQGEKRKELWLEARKQWEQNEPINDPTSKSIGTIDQFCSLCNQKKPLTDFGRFLTCNPYRQRN